MLSLFATLFSYTVDDFDALTPRQAFMILVTKGKREHQERIFQLYQHRLTNFFIVKSSFGETKSIRSAEDLYRIEDDESHEETPVKMNEDDMKFIHKVIATQ